MIYLDDDVLYIRDDSAARLLVREFRISSWFDQSARLGVGGTMVNVEQGEWILALYAVSAPSIGAWLYDKFMNGTPFTIDVVQDGRYGRGTVRPLTHDLTTFAYHIGQSTVEQEVMINIVFVGDGPPPPVLDRDA